MKIDVKKILEEILKNKQHAIAIFDFDYTITNNKSNSSIGVFTEYLPTKYKIKKQKIDNITLKINSKIGYYIIWKYKLNLLSKYYSETLINNINYKKEFQFNVDIYKLIVEIQKNNIPIIICSSGITDIIKKFLELNKINLKGITIIANSIDLNTQKTSKKIITPKNKKNFHIEEKTHKYVFGDRIEDLNIVENSIKYLVSDNGIKILK